MTETLPFYNYLGEIEYIPGYPLSFGHWSSSTDEDVSTDHRLLIADVSRILRKSPTESSVRALGSNLTVEIGFDDGSKVIARKILPDPEDDTNENQGMQKLHSEVRILKWLAERSDIPVPQILYPVDDQYRDFIIMNKLPGTMLLNIYGTLDTLAKERLVESYADIALELFRLDVPQKIGTLVPDISSESLDVIPRIALQRFRATRVFEDIRQYLDFLFDMKMNSPVIGGDDGGHVNELRQYVDVLLDNLLSKPDTSTLHRCVLVHEDLNDMNILVDTSGCITGIIDWEYQTLWPEILAADYPPWLLYEGLDDPRFSDPKQIFWLDSPKESKRLCDLYLQIIKGKDHDYWNALVQGAMLRSCVKWLLDYQNDPGCKRMKKWMDATFKGSCSK